MSLPAKGAPWLTGVIEIAIGIEIGGCRCHGGGKWRTRDKIIANTNTRYR
ncbi:MAG: hypothetical protein ABIL58_01175 [Pseudomonadota bacterium]